MGLGLGLLVLAMLCPEAVAAETPVPGADPAQDEVGLVAVNVPGIGSVGVMASSHWMVQVSEGTPSSTLSLIDLAMNIQLTFVPRSTPRDEQGQKRSVRAMGEQYLPTSVEETVHMKRLRTGIGMAILANFNDRTIKSSEIPAGEYSSTTIGQIDHEHMTVHVRVLTNGSDTPEHDNALLVLESIHPLVDF